MTISSRRDEWGGIHRTRVEEYALGLYDDMLAGRSSTGEPPLSLRLDLLYLQAMRRTGNLRQAELLVRSRLMDGDAPPYYHLILDLGLGRADLPSVLAVCRDSDDRFLAYVACGMDLATRGAYGESRSWLELVLAHGPAGQYHPLAEAEIRNLDGVCGQKEGIERIVLLAVAHLKLNQREQTQHLAWVAASTAWETLGADHPLTIRCLKFLAEETGGPRDEVMGQEMADAATRALAKVLGGAHPLAQRADPWLQDAAAEPPLDAGLPLESEPTVDTSDWVIIEATRDIPPFYGPDLQRYEIKAGQRSRVPLSIAHLLEKNGRANIVAPEDEVKQE